MFRSIISVLIALLFVASCNEAQLQTAMNTSVGLLQAQALSESQVIQKASLASTELDSKSKIARSDSNYTRRLNRLINGLTSYEGLSLNYKVYMADSVNAFAMADGTIRVHSALMDIMPDDQVLAVIAHEVGHVKLKHSYKQMRKAILTNTAFQAAASADGTFGELTRSQLGQLAYTAVNAHFSQKDELSSDRFAVKMLKSMGRDPYAMKRSIETLQSKEQSHPVSFLSSHPSNSKRLENIDNAIKGK